MHVTNHARKRMRERCGFNKSSCDRMAKKALTEGIPHSQTKGCLNKWVTSLYFKNKTANNIRLYGDKAYIFHDTALITILPIPSNLAHNLKTMTKTDRKEYTTCTSKL